MAARYRVNVDVWVEAKDEEAAADKVAKLMDGLERRQTAVKETNLVRVD